METRDHVPAGAGDGDGDRDDDRDDGLDDESDDGLFDESDEHDERGRRVERGRDERGRRAGERRRRDTAIFTLGEGTGRKEQPELHRLLRGIADEVAPVPRGDFFPQVVKRAAVIRRRRRAMRASSVTAVLAAAVVFGPTVARELGVRGGAAVAAPPSAVVDLASAYPEAEPSSTAMVPLVAARPANALSWPVRGDALPGDAVNLAVSYLVERGEGAADAGGIVGSGSVSSGGAPSGSPPSGGPTPGDATSGSPSGADDPAADAATAEAGAAEPDMAATGAAAASVTTLWAGVEDDTTGIVAQREAGDAGINVNGSPQRLVTQDAHKTWLFVMQGWRVGLDRAPSSQAVLLVGEYTQTGSRTSMTVRSAPVAFAHARPGSGDDKNDTDQIAELSVWLPDSGRLLVLGAPQAKTVLYAKTGGDLIPQKTVDGVALFPRTRSLVKGRYADTVQVRDAKNVALTPPKAWSAGDFALSGMAWRWDGSEAGWVSVVGVVPAPVVPSGVVPAVTGPATGGRGKSSPAPSSAPSAPPATAPSKAVKVTGPPSAPSTRVPSAFGAVRPGAAGISGTVGFVDTF